jgi:DNA-binding NtrC family response regulator
MATRRLVLVVYADTEDRVNTVALLEAAGYRVASASTFQDAKHLLASEAPDLLITDLRLGSYNGIHLVLRSRSDHPDMAALVTSHFPDPVLEAEAQREQARFLLRPIADDDLLDAITTLLAGTYRAAAGAPPSSDLC